MLEQTVEHKKLVYKMNIVDKRDKKADRKLIKKLESINEVALTGTISYRHTSHTPCEIRPGPLASLE